LSQEPDGDERCGHSGYYSGVGLYSRDSRSLRYVLVCDDCGEEMKEFLTVDYVPQPVFAFD
jgi:hypothetical protein